MFKNLQKKFKLFDNFKNLTKKTKKFTKKQIQNYKSLNYSTISIFAVPISN